MAWRRFFRRRYWDGERAREIEEYLEFETAENVARGMTAEEARYAARRKFGNPTLIREEIYRMNSVGFLEALWQDLRYGMRGLRLSPGFAAVAILSLALGIGANTAIFQLFDAVRLKLLPVKEPGQLVEVATRKESRRQWTGRFFGRQPHVTYALWQEIREHQQVFSEMAAWGNSSMNIAPAGEVHKVDGLYVSGNFFHALGVTPLVGRVFNSTDDQHGCGAPGAVISFAFWQGEFGGKANIIGQKLTLNGRPFEVIGVTPANFFGVDVGHQFDVAVPICSQPLLEPDDNKLEDRQYWWLAAIGRLKQGVTVAQASAQLDVISPGIFQATVPANFRVDSARDYRKFRLGAFPAGSGLSSLRKTYETPLILLLSIAGLVLLIACANLTNLMLARASARERKIAVRLALGASRWRLVFQLLTESILLALIGAALGIGMAQLLSRFLVLLISTSADQISLNTTPGAHVLGFTAGLAAVTCVLFGLTPALRGTRMEPNAVMKAASRGLSASRERFGLRRMLVLSQVALSLVLLAGALLFIRSLTKLLTVDPGFQQSGVLITRLDITKLGLSADRQRETNRELLDRLRHIPGADGAAMFTIAPATGTFSNNAVTVGGDESRKYKADFNWVSDGYFKTLRIPLVAGRDFDEKDTPTSPKVAIVNEAFARECTGGANPIGIRFRLPGAPGSAEPFYEIVGVVKNTKYEGLREAFPAIIFEAESQRTDNNSEPNYFIRSRISFAALSDSVKRTVSRLTPTAGLSFESFKSDIQNTLLPERLMATLAGCFGLLAVVLATVGLYGVMAYIVTRRRNEIGIRMALGADKKTVISMVLREAAGLLIIGVAAGMVLTLIAAGAANALLFGVPSWDPVSLGIAVGGLVFVGVIASGVPALRAARLNPMVALREE